MERIFSESKKTEILEAERAKDEVRDIMTRMIGAEIRYTQVGYWMRQPPFGFDGEKIETGQHGKRCVLKPHPTEGTIDTQDVWAESSRHDERPPDSG